MRKTMTRVRRAMAGLTVTTVAVTALTACGSDDHNDADVTFATDMIPHHAQAVEMAAMVDGKEVDPEVVGLASDIEAAQAPEIETMTGWLEDWDEPVPETGSMGSMEGMDGMPGMMSDQEMADLEAAEGPAFQTMWLQMMIEHHEGAVEMAQSEQDEGQYGPATDLAEDIEAAQTEEIAVMEDLLGGS